ncbi:MAG: efflux RND transporter permease subunit [Myxococcota bacterium]
MKLADVSIRRPVFATVMVGALVVFGLASLPRIGVDLFPEVEFPVATVTAVYPGADPETIETKVVEKLEEAVGEVSGIKNLRSTSMENVGLLVIEFELERDADRAAQDVRDKVSAALTELPADLDPPVIEKFDIGAAPVLSLAVSGPLPTRELTRLADDVIKGKLQTLGGVGGVDLVGDQEREFHVWLSPDQLERYGLATSDVLQALTAQNVEIPGGRMNVGRQEMVVKTRGQVHTAEELGDIIVTAMAGAPVRIRDVARVEDGLEEKRSHAALDGESAVGLVVRKQSGANTVEVAEAVRAALDDLRAEMPDGVSIGVPVDNSTFIQKSISDVQFDLVFGGVLAILIILFFLHDWRATVVSALALPSSVIATFAFIDAMGFTFNNMTMLALTLSIGILIDDAIVVIENIHRHLEMGKPPLKAARDGASEIGLAVMATTASIVAVFIPVAIMEGIIGRFFLQFGLTVAFAVSVSFFVAFTITPAYAARLLKPHGGTKNPVARFIEWMLSGLDRAYRGLLGASLRHPVISLVAGFGIFAASLQLLGMVPTEFLPEEDRGQFNLSVEMPTGTDLETTREYVSEVSGQVREVPGVASTFTTIGAGTQGEVHKAVVQVNLVPRKQRAFSQSEAMNHVRAKLSGLGDAKFAVEQIQAVGGGNSAFRSAAVQFNIRGNDLGELQGAASDLIEILRDEEGYVDLDMTYRGGKPEVQVNIDRPRAADLGVPIAQVAMTLRTFFAGEKASEIQTPQGRYDVRARLPDRLRAEPNAIRDLTVRSTSGQLVKLADVVDVDLGAGPSQIDRQNRQRQVTVLANLQGKPLGMAVEEINEAAAEVVPAHLTTDWTGRGDTMKESFVNMIRALILAIILVFLILAAQFESFLHPFTIMLSLPLSVTGAFGALAITGMTLNIFSMIGFIMLMGLVTKNAILLVDYTNTVRERGIPRREALLEAGPVRLRPILMTTAAMIFGMIPVAMAQSEGGEQRAPMAVAVIGGLITSTLLTLVVVPVVYDLLDALKEKVLGRQESAEPATEAA